MTFTRQTVAAAVLVVATAAGLVGAAPAYAAAPTITSFTPTSGPLNTVVTVTGTSFAAPATVLFNGTPAAAVSVTSTTTLLARVSGTATTGPITVTTAGGTVTSSASFTVTPGVALTRTVGPPTSALTAYFSAFAPYEPVDVYVDTTDLALVSASAAGAGSAALTIPANAAPGIHWITAVGRRSGNSGQMAFLVRTDWAQQGDNAAQTNANPYEGTLGTSNVSTLTQGWNSLVPAGSGIQTAPVIAGGIAYVGTTVGIVAFAEGTGAVLWSQSITGGVTSTPTVAAGLVLVGTSAGHLTAFAASTGALRYDFGFSGRTFPHPVVVSGTAGYIESEGATAGNGAILAFEVASGVQDWSTPLNSTCAGVAVAYGTVYTSCQDGLLHLLNAATGAGHTATPLRYQPSSSPAVANGVVVTAGTDTTSNTNAVGAYDADTGLNLWTKDVSVVTGSSTEVTVDRGEALLDSYNPTTGVASVEAFAAATGDLLWTTTVAYGGFPAVAAANGVVYAPGGTAITALDETTGAVVSRFRGSGAAVVTDAGLLTLTVYGRSLVRYTLPAPATSNAVPATAPQAARLRPDLRLRAVSSTG